MTTIEEIMAHSKNHEVVGFALRSLSPTPEGVFMPPANLSNVLTDRLGQCSHDGDLLAAVFGLTELAGFLGNERKSPDAAQAIYEALATTTDAVRDAISALETTPEMKREMRDDRFGAFLGQSTTPTVAPDRPPAEGEVRGGLMARLAATTPDDDER